VKRVLIVDDDPDTTECLELMLRDTYSVTLAENGSRGLERLRAEAFDAVVLDVMMPVLDGVAVVETLRREGNRVPIILASATSNLKALAARLGVSDYIAKPYDFQLLLRKIALAASGPLTG
jgi:CheY-like chemotaxis protein